MAISRKSMDKYIDGKLVEKGENPDEQPKRLNFYWWDSDEANMPADIQNTVRFLDSHQAARMEQLIVGTRLYGNANAFSMLGSSFTRASSVNTNPSSQRLSFNLCSSVIDTLTAKMAKNKIEIMFITNGGDWDTQMKAEQLSKFVGGLMHESDFHSKKVNAFTQSGAWGDGLTYIYARNGKVTCEPAYPHEFKVDLVETLSGPPTQMHRVKIAERGVFAAQFEDKKDKQLILDAQPANLQELGAVGTAADLIIVIDSYHLPSDPSVKPDASVDETDGRHVIIVGDKCLAIEPWTKNYFPFPRRSYCKTLIGFWGQSACERLQNMQGEINRSLILEQRSRWMQGSFKILVENGSKIVSQHLTNDVGAIIHYTGTVPQYVTPPAIDSSNREWINQLIQNGYNQEGVSILEAASVKPMGVNSGKAMRTMANIADDRQLFLQQEDDRFTMENAFQMIAVAKEIAKDSKGSYKTIFPQTTFAEEIDWKDINLDASKYVMKAFPMSSLADDLTGRLEDIQEYMQAGIISPRAGRRLLRKPDLEMADKLADAPEDLLHKIFETMLAGKGFMAPNPKMDLGLAKELGLQYWNYAVYHNCPAKNLKLLDKFLKLLDDLTGLNQPAAPPVAAAGPQAVPAAPPVSNILPNAPLKRAA